jgi:hypothetical protein
VSSFFKKAVLLDILQLCFEIGSAESHNLFALRVVLNCFHSDFGSLTNMCMILYLLIGSRGSSVSTVSDYELDDRGSIPDRGRGFFFQLLRPDRLWGPPSLLPNGYRGSFPRGKARPGRDADHSPPSSAEVENE